MDSFLVGKKIVVGVSGSIAAFKVAGWVSTMAKADAEVDVILTAGGEQFITAQTLSALAGKKCHGAMFHGDDSGMAHIDLGAEADVILIAPASANAIARLAHGLASDLLSTTALAAHCPVVVCPAMNPQMYRHPATQANIAKLREYGYIVVNPDSGMVACRQEGPGRLAEWGTVREFLARILLKQDLLGKRVLVTAGPTREVLDPARFISNRSSGKMGFSLARAAWRRGAKVVLVSGPSSEATPIGVERIDIISASEMYKEVMERAAWADIIIKSAAVSDFRPKEVAKEKVKKDSASLHIELVTNPDILKALGEKKRADQILVGFAAESCNHEEAGRKKLVFKNLDLIAINDIAGANTGFESNTNSLLVLGRDRQKSLPLTAKNKIADLLLNEIISTC